MKTNNPEFPRLIAHRGASAFAPENTELAMRKAKQMGASWVEFDVMPCASGVWVVIHDDTIDRTSNGCGAVAELPLHTLKSYDYRNNFDTGGISIPLLTLEECLSLLIELELSVNIEIKPDTQHVEQCINVIDAFTPRLINPPLISSSSTNTLQHVRRHAPDAQLAYIIEHWSNDAIAIAQKLNCISINCDHMQLSADIISHIHTQQLKILAYTVNEIDRANTLFAWGVDSIFSDNPKLFEI